jgi:hypothetical protein
MCVGSSLRNRHSLVQGMLKAAVHVHWLRCIGPTRNGPANEHVLSRVAVLQGLGGPAALCSGGYRWAMSVRVASPSCHWPIGNRFSHSSPFIVPNNLSKVQIS